MEIPEAGFVAFAIAVRRRALRECEIEGLRGGASRLACVIENRYPDMGREGILPRMGCLQASERVTNLPHLSEFQLER